MLSEGVLSICYQRVCNHECRGVPAVAWLMRSTLVMMVGPLLITASARTLAASICSFVPGKMGSVVVG